jgi:phenylacetate-CoA ligase
MPPGEEDRQSPIRHRTAGFLRIGMQKAIPAKRNAQMQRTAPRAAMVQSILKGMMRAERQPAWARRFTQRAHLERLLGHVAMHVPYYRDCLQEAGFRPDRPLSEEVWQQIPVLTRQQVQVSAPLLQATALPPSHGPIRESRTSGSTGVPLRVSKTAVSSLFWDAVTIREMLWQRRDRSRPWHAIRYVGDGSAEYPRGAKSPSWGRVAELLGPTGPGYGLDIKTDPSLQFAWLQRHQPSYLLTYPSNLRALLDATRSTARPFPHLRHVVTVAESLPDGLREQCREQWGVRICDIYSAAEVGYIAIQAPYGDHYLVPEEVVRVEILDDAGNPVKRGESGRVVVTPLFNYAMPLIRYEIGDYAELGGRSPCGRTLPVINRILGRVRHMLTYPDGRKSWPSFSDGRFREVAPVRQFRVIQRAADMLELQVAAERPLIETERSSLAAMVRDRVGPPFRVEVTQHAEIPRSAGGKYEDFRNDFACP